MGSVRLSLIALGVVLLVGCGGTPNAQATQTRTNEIVELTVSARLLPTANAAIPPTPIPTPDTPNGAATMTAVRVTTGGVPVPAPSVTLPPVSSTPPPSRGCPPLINSSWVAYSQTVRVRFFAPPSLVESPEFNSDYRYSLASPSNVYDFETLDIYRFVGNRGGDFARTWQSEMDAFGRGRNVGALRVTSGPRQQQVASYQGNVGQFHYDQLDNDLEISGSLWVGQVGGDEAMIIYRCTPEREVNLDAEFAQVLATIDFAAR